MKIADVVSSCIQISIKASSTARHRIIAKQSDMNFDFTGFQKKLQDLLRRSVETEHDIDMLKKSYLTAKIDTKVVGLIEDKLGILSKAREELEEAQRIYIQIKTKFGSNRAASKLLQESKNVVNKLDSVYSTAKSVVENIAEKKSPSILSEKNKVVDQLYDILQEEIDLNNENEKVTSKSRFGNESFSVTSTPNGLKFAKYIELKNFPKTDKKTLKNLFAILTAELSIPKSKKGRRVIGDFSDIYLTISPLKVSPDKLPKSYKVRSIKEIRNVLSYLAYENNLNSFSNFMTKANKSRLEQLKTAGKIRVLDKEGVKFSTKDNKIKVIVPRKLIDNKSGEPGTNNFANLYVDVQRLAGLPQTGPKARYTSGRIKYTEKKKGDNYIYVFTIFPMSPVFDMEDDSTDKKLVTDREADQIVKEMFKDDSDMDYLVKDLQDYKKREA